MSSQTSSPGNSGQGRGPDGGKSRSVKTSITRVRTGCLTCRRRRKKCDERKPVCENCQRTNVVCEGFPRQVYWENRSAAKRAVVPKSTPCALVTNFHSSPNTASTTGIPDGSMDFPQWPDQFPSQFPQQYQAQALARFDDRSLEDDGGFNFDQFNISANSGVTNLDQRNGFVDYQGASRELVARDGSSRERALAYSTFQEPFIPIELPFLITGVDTPIHQKLFCHFTSTMSQLLTIFPGQSNPFNQIIIPMAMGDQIVMNTLLCLAGSHLLKVQPMAPCPELATERSRLHEDSVREQALRVEDLRRTATGPDPMYPIQYQESILATSLLLCLFEICEGTDDGTWKHHLKTAREIITIASISTNPSNRTTELNPFLLEFFLYHDSLATVTSPSTPVMKNKFRNVAELPEQDTSMIGVQDGLIEFITRISALRTAADASTHSPDGNVVCTAVQIWQDLSNWKPKSLITKERKLITDFYQWALFIWLYSIVYPDGKSDEKIQNAVKRIVKGMWEIKDGDGVMACLLFPLFVVGSAAIEKGDREDVLKHFRKLRNWSALGNIDLSEKVVTDMWVAHDNGIARSWDWVKQLETVGMSLLVT